MQYIVAALAFAAYASAQSISACDGKAQPCLDKATESSGVCQVGDWACGCKNLEAIQGAATTCVITACGGATGALDVLSEVQAICANLPAGGSSGSSEGETPAPVAETTAPAPAAESSAPAAEDISAEAPTTLATAVTTATGEATAPTSTFAQTNGAGAVGPMAAVLLGAAAFAL